MNWQNLFAPHILARGYDYYLEGTVDKLKIDINEITASVSGTADYKVEIELSNNRVIAMSCNCPYAEDDNNCKHMAAVMYEAFEVENEDDEDVNYVDKNVVASDDDMLSKMVESAPIETVKAFLKSILMDQPHLMLRFRNLVHTATSSHPFVRADYEQRINSIERNHMGRERFINYYRADAYISDLQELLDEDASDLIDSNHLLSAFELTTLVLQSVSDVDMDDSGGGTTVIANQCFMIWKSILNKSDVTVKRTLFEWFTTHLDGQIIDYLEEYIERILAESFQDAIFIDDMLAFAAKKAAAYENMPESWTRDYHVGIWATTYLELLITNARPESEILTYSDKYWKYSEVRKTCVQYYLDQNDHKRAIEILKTSIDLDANLSGLVKSYRLQLKDVYLKNCDHDAYLEQLWNLMLIDFSNDIALYKELKSHYSDQEWLDKRELIFNAFQNSIALDTFYLEEHLYDRLLDAVQNSKGIDRLQKYEKVLSPLFPKEVLNKYEYEISQMAQPTTDRKRYNYLVSLLRHMKHMPGGKVVVSDIALHWRFVYGNRSAMMDELRKL